MVILEALSFQLCIDLLHILVVVQLPLPDYTTTRSWIIGEVQPHQLLLTAVCLHNCTNMNVFSIFAAGTTVVAGSVVVYILWDVSRKRCSSLHSYRTKMKHYLINQTIGIIGKRMARAVEHDTANAVKVQEELLRKLIKTNAATVYGKEHGFCQIHNREDYILAHPLTRYDHYERYIDQIARGENCILTHSKPFQLGVTSGTSGRNSLLPVTREMVKTFFLYGVSVIYKKTEECYPEANELQKCLKFFYKCNWRTSAGGLLIGPPSSNPKNLQSVLELYSTPREVLELMNEQVVLYLHLLFALKDRNLGRLEANFASLVYAGFQTLRLRWRDLVQDIREGRINAGLDIDPTTRQTLTSLLKPDSNRASELEEQFAKGFEGIAKRIWPHLHLVLTVDTGAFELYGDLLKDHECKGIPFYSPIYAASEGLIGVNMNPTLKQRTYLLIPTAMFFEFIPIEQTSEKQPKTLFVDQVHQGGIYELVITNLCGLYRYRFGDVVKIVGFHNSMPKVEYMYRQGQLLNIRGEKVSEKSFYSCLVQALDTMPHTTCTNMVDYCCAESALLNNIEGSFISKSQLAHYVLFIETEDCEDDLDTDKLASLLDEQLQMGSYPYESFRVKDSLGCVEVLRVTCGSFSQLKEYILNTTEASTNQFKVPRVLRKPELVMFMIERRVNK